MVSLQVVGIFIGKSGKNVANLKDKTSIKADVSKFVLGMHDRVFTVIGGLKTSQKLILLC